MKNILKIIFAILIVALVASIIIFKKPVEVTPNPDVAKITGCYVARLGSDVYSLDIASQQEESFSGTLVFKNYQKDSSFGAYVGTYKNGILLGDYSFRSEGTDSVMQVIFKRQGTDFVRGFGSIDTSSGTRFTDLTNITYDGSQAFKATTETCTTTLL